MMDSPRHRRSGLLRAVPRLLTVALALGLTVLVPVSAASAHDVLTGTQPGNGQTMKVLPKAIELSFNNMPLAIGTEVAIEDTAGKNWAAGEVKIVDNVVSQPLLPATPGGKYTVNWRVVSSDGHPIEGTFVFSAAAGGAGATSALTPVSEPAADSSAAPQAPTSGAFPVSPIIGSFVVLLALVLALIVARYLRGRKQSHGSE
ncbi:MAG: copper resistance protein CopC [Paeniglutamicibacter terrestris]